MRKNIVEAETVAATKMLTEAAVEVAIRLQGSGDEIFAEDGKYDSRRGCKKRSNNCWKESPKDQTNSSTSKAAAEVTMEGKLTRQRRCLQSTGRSLGRRLEKSWCQKWGRVCDKDFSGTAAGSGQESHRASKKRKHCDRCYNRDCGGSFSVVCVESMSYVPTITTIEVSSHAERSNGSNHEGVAPIKTATKAVIVALRWQKQKRERGDSVTEIAMFAG